MSAFPAMYCSMLQLDPGYDICQDYSVRECKDQHVKGSEDKEAEKIG